jgi:arginase
LSGLTTFHFDAHSDLHETFEGSRLLHARPFCADHGIGTGEAVGAGRDSHPNRHQREQLQRFGVEAVEMPALPAYEKLKSAGPVYLTFDTDVLDPAFAPGVWHREPGGNVGARGDCAFTCD